MASLEALGLASNIIQVIDFVSKLITNARTLYKSAHRSSPHSLVLQDVANNLIRLSELITVSNGPGDEGLKKLAQSAKEVSNDILIILDDLKIRGKKTKWKSFLLAVKEVRNQDVLTSITSSIKRLQTQMTLHIQFQIKSDIAALSTDIQTLQSKSDQLQLNNDRELKKLRTDLLGAFHAINTTSEYQHNDQHEHYEKAIGLDFERLAIGDFHTISQSLPSYTSKISALSQGINSVADGQEIIKLFHFDRFSAREEQISEAHAKTFEWVFRDILPDGKTTIGFPNWLRSGNGIFWIRGKAGSGKSTLMKLISHHPTTLEDLRCWSGSQKLVTGRFYFWNSGTDLQKSQEGLLRSLIFEILRQCPELAIYVKHSLMRMSTTKDSTQLVLERLKKEGWLFRQLTEILSSMLSQSENKFFFIIDGLDEYKAQYTQDHQDLINAIQKLGAAPRVKLCVSSRPWTVFMDAFGGDINQCLKLEDLNREDIRSYVTDRFLTHNQYEKLISKDSNYASLVNSVVEKSQGVFLWVFLVVRELLDGLTYNDTLSVMQQRLNSFPDTLEHFFQHMLDSVPKVYQSQTAQIFQMSLSCEYSLPMIYYSFLGDINESPELIAQEASLPICLPEFLQRQDIMQRNLDAWCKGLLEIPNPIREVDITCSQDYVQPEVDFLHRSVRDFIVSGTITTLTERPESERRCTWLRFCNALILSIKRLAASEFKSCKPGVKVLAIFAGNAQKDGVDSHTINKIMLEGCDAMASLLPDDVSRSESDQRFVFQALRRGLRTFVELKVLSMEETDIADIMRSCLEKPFIDPDMIRWLISCVQMKGPSSKDMLEDTFDAFIEFINTNQHHLGPDEILDRVRAIASTGYEVDDSFITTQLPDYHSELRSANSGSDRQTLRLEDGAVKVGGSGFTLLIKRTKTIFRTVRLRGSRRLKR
ncbi:hypothetical protein F5Y03DRAFT_262244 [Xylaria venustula]|nr:hypothetical protein F5Y03DRAFT_262244 [Xylaria venustula]